MKITDDYFNKNKELNINSIFRRILNDGIVLGMEESKRALNGLLEKKIEMGYPPHIIKDDLNIFMDEYIELTRQARAADLSAATERKKFSIKTRTEPVKIGNDYFWQRAKFAGKEGIVTVETKGGSLRRLGWQVRYPNAESTCFADDSELLDIIYE